jgi:dienelactone hydrolase
MSSPRPHCVFAYALIANRTLTCAGVLLALLLTTGCARDDNEPGDVYAVGQGGSPYCGGSCPPVAGKGGAYAPSAGAGGAGGTPPGGPGPEAAGTDSAGGPGGLGTGGQAPIGTCCPDGDCLCHGPDPTGLTSAAGPFETTSYPVALGTIYYPTDAVPPFAGVALCGGFLNTGPEMEPWGPFYASHGIVTIIVTTTGADLPDLRAQKLLAAIEALKTENTMSGGPLSGKMSDRYGTSGYSMGGGGTTIASAGTPTLKSSIGLAPWGGTGVGVTVPTLLLCGTTDTVAPCSMSEAVYGEITAPTEKMMVTIAGATHYVWFGPEDAGAGASGAVALAFQKVYLEGDTRWKPFMKDAMGTIATNIP